MAVGLGAHCDPPKVEQRLLETFTEKFDGAPSLPFVAWVTPDFEWIHGFAGGRTVKEFEADLDLVERSPLLPASQKDADRLSELGRVARDAAEEKSWADVLKQARSAAEIRGGCPGRVMLDTAVAKARSWAAGEFYVAVERALTEDDLKPSLDALRAIKRDFKGDPEAETAARGLKAIDLYRRNARLSGEKRTAAMEKARTAYADTEWEALFAE